MSIEIFNGPFAAQLWAESHADFLIQTAVSNRALDWELTRTAWGVSLEINFATESEWESFKSSNAVHEALKAVPDPTGGVLIYRGRSLDSGNPLPRKPRPKFDSGSNALSIPIELPSLDMSENKPLTVLINK